MRNKFVSSLVVGLMLAAISQVAGAYAIQYNGVAQTPTLCATGSTNSNPAFLASALSAACAGPTALELYKQDVGAAADTGAFASSYSTAFFNTPADPADATISYVGAPAINCGAFGCWLGLKDGNADPAYYIFNISNWNGTSSILMTGFWPGTGAISHVSIFGSLTGSSSSSAGGEGSSSSGNQVPESSSTLVLLGLGILGIGFMRRRKQGA